jgi:hypothetical protein
LEDVQGYTETLAYQDFAPWSYLDGFFDDPSTRGTTNKRAKLVTEDGDNKILQVMLPEGCVTSECAMQAKHVFIQPTESATLKFRWASPLPSDSQRPVLSCMATPCQLVVAEPALPGHKRFCLMS